MQAPSLCQNGDTLGVGGRGESIGPYATEIYKTAHGTHNDIKECGLLNTVLIKMSVTFP